MKKLITIAIFFAATITSYSQSLEYQELGILFSQNDNNGSARYTAMSGAFGALGGDVSSININPAGIAVFNSSAFSGTFNSRTSDITSNYYNNKVFTQNQFLNLSHAGAVLVFDIAYKSDWKKFAIGFNYRITKDFADSFLAKGNSGIPTFRDFPLDNNNPTIDYNQADEQQFSNTFKGEISEFNVAFSSVHLNKLYIGMGLNFYDLNFSQQSNLTEFNNDGNENDLDANYYQENFTTGTGFSANAGFIYKAHQNFRFGLSYQTPTWYSEIYENTNILDNDGFYGDTNIAVSNDNIEYSNNVDNSGNDFYPSQEFAYKLKTPAKTTASFAYIFGKNGLFSLDYSMKNYKNLKLSNADFTSENQYFLNNLRNTYTLNIGSEWRFKSLSIRGGYHYEQSPDANAIESDNIKGYSLGAGFSFGNTKLDFAYQDRNNTQLYDFYPQYNQVNAAELNIDNKIITT